MHVYKSLFWKNFAVREETESEYNGMIVIVYNCFLITVQSSLWVFIKQSGMNSKTLHSRDRKGSL